MAGPPVRLAHFSDLHLPITRLGRRWHDLMSKRATASVNLIIFGRARRFSDGIRVLEALNADLDAARPDLYLFSGDISAMGLPREMKQGAELLRVGERDGATVPGNHDLYTHESLRSRWFEKDFRPWLAGKRVHEQSDYPFAREIGGRWVVCVNSAVPNRIFWNARGRVGATQLHRLEALLQSLPADAPKILMTHYPYRMEDGARESYWHRLIDSDALHAACVRHNISAWLHGHHHHPFEVEKDGVTCFCAGSGTQAGICSYNRYVWTDRLEMERRVFDPKQGKFIGGPKAARVEARETAKMEEGKPDGG